MASTVWLKSGVLLVEMASSVFACSSSQVTASCRTNPLSNKAVATKKYLKSPLNYIGGKYKLLPQILPLFPKEISSFVDLFSAVIF